MVEDIAMKRSLVWFAWLVDGFTEALDRAPLLRRGPSRFVIVQEGGRYRLYRRRRGQARLLDEGAWPRLADVALPRRARRAPIEARMDADRAVRRELRLPRGSRPYVEMVVMHQLDRLTPWSGEDAAFDCKVDSEDRGREDIGVNVVAASRTTLDELTRSIEAAGLSVGTVGLSDTSLETESPVDILKRSRDRHRAGMRRIASAVVAATLCAAVAASSYAGFRYWRAAAEAGQIEMRIADLRARMTDRAATAPVSQLPGMLADKQALRPTVIVIDTLTRLLPDDTHLSALSITGGEFVISGQSEDAPALIPVLEDSDMLRAVRFASATSRDIVSRKDRFEIAGSISSPRGTP
jgi:general secretion pathway protein L